MKKLYLFDMDGTIRDDFSAVYESMVEVFHEFGRNPPTIREYRNNPSPDFWDTYKKRGFDESEKQAVERRFSEIFHSRYEAAVKIFPDAYPAISGLKNNGAMIGVVSNHRAAAVKSQLADYGLEKFVSVVVGGDEVEERKPSAKPLLVAFRRLGISPQNGCYVADKTWDIMSAHAAGTEAIAISRKLGQHEESALFAANPEKLIHNLEELLVE
ncbi:MAG: HAD family hydrolase [Candidatus Aenigmarchaeota archaeon]|nr:HAD family hydrolase [Candidatus Aenigmarchaeota archaeon]